MQQREVASHVVCPRFFHPDSLIMKTLLILAVLTITLSIPARAAAEYETDLNKAVAAASEQKKMMFVIYGREACGNCQATKQMVKSRQIKVPESKFVLVDLNCDDKAVS